MSFMKLAALLEQSLYFCEKLITLRASTKANGWDRTPTPISSHTNVDALDGDVRRAKAEADMMGKITSHDASMSGSNDSMNTQCHCALAEETRCA